VKSFQIYLGPPKITPQRFATDYSSQEQSQLREEFKPLAKKYRERMRAAYITLAVGFACILLVFFLPKNLLPWMIGGFFICWLVVVFLAVVSPMPNCPACKNKIDGDFGDYCPECGANALKRRSWFRAPQCSACGKIMQRGKSRQYSIRACTYCGVMLDEKGL
jgi:predicted RNA-binding Zn-ribbon protein involved in translation (DUF1610 family)